MMNLRKQIFLQLCSIMIAFFCIAIQPVKAAEKNAQDLSQLLADAFTMQAQFSQFTMDKSGGQIQKATGVMHVKRPGLFRWETEEPFPQLVIANGESVSLYDPDLEQVTIQKIDGDLKHTPALLLSGDSQALSKQYSVSGQQNGASTEFTLKPISKDGLFETMGLKFDKGKIKEMNFEDSLGQKTRVVFEQVKYNSDLAAGLFQFTPPEGVDIIQQ